MFLKEISDLQEECESGEVALIMFRQIKTLVWINKNKLSNSLHCKGSKPFHLGSKIETSRAF